jgi:outer membrane lipoprotein-sorting protein
MTGEKMTFEEKNGQFKRFAMLFIVCTTVSWPFASLAQTAEEKGLEIAVEADKRDIGWGDSQSSMLMVLRNKAGKSSNREVRIRNLEVQGDGDKSISVFDKPVDVKGTSFLSHTHVLTPDDQWLYLPALKRVKRISSANKSGPFMGSEFSYEDLSSQEIEKYKYKHLADEELNGRAVFKIERIPTYAKSGYTKQIAWIDQEHYYVLKTEFYDRKGSLLKTLIASDYKQYLEQYWRPGKMAMQNHQNGKSTDLVWKDYKFANGFVDADFTQASLKRIR